MRPCPARGPSSPLLSDAKWLGSAFPVSHPPLVSLAPHCDARLAALLGAPHVGTRSHRARHPRAPRSRLLTSGIACRDLWPLHMLAAVLLGHPRPSLGLSFHPYSLIPPPLLVAWYVPDATIIRRPVLWPLDAWPPVARCEVSCPRWDRDRASCVLKQAQCTPWIDRSLTAIEEP